ncbi:MAG: nuclear transport factor 2 family protein [Alphaproteobacteria bacterium]|nr:nuclear transport factor 2 family protein [Alphaproteobacteria bacterium]
MSTEKVKNFLRIMEDRDLETAKTFLAPEFRMTFPGGISMTTLDELVSWSKGRYKSISKTFEDFDEFQDGEETVVYSTGMLNGEALDGSAISEVRYIDRFVFRDGLMVDQQVWNDLADVLPKSASAE